MDDVILNSLSPNQLQRVMSNINEIVSISAKRCEFASQNVENAGSKTKSDRRGGDQ